MSPQQSFAPQPLLITVYVIGCICLYGPLSLLQPAVIEHSPISGFMLLLSDTASRDNESVACSDLKVLALLSCLIFFFSLREKLVCPCRRSFVFWELWKLWTLYNTTLYHCHAEHQFLREWLFKIVYRDTSGRVTANCLNTVPHQCTWFIRMQVTVVTIHLRAVALFESMLDHRFPVSGHCWK